MPNRMDEEWLSNEHYVTRPDSTVKILAIGDHNDGNADYMKNYATSHPNYACVHINTSLKNNYSGVIVDLLNSISTQNYKIQLVILAYKFITSSSTECLLYFSSPVSNFSQSGVLIEIPGTDEIYSGMTADAKIKVAERENVVRVPLTAVRKGDVVYKKSSTEDFQDSDTTVPKGYEKVKVELGLNSEEYIEILSGLSENDVVLIDKVKESGTLNMDNSMTMMREN